MKKIFQFASRPAIARTLLLVLAALPEAHSMLYAQALPAAEAAPISTGFSLPSALGTLNYAITGSQGLEWGYNGNSGITSSTSVSGDLAYLSASRQHPFSMVLTGGHSFGEQGQPAYNYFGLSMSQVANVGRWNIILTDTPSYLPGTPAAGLSGIPGVGDLNVSPVETTGDAGQGILTNYSDRVSNNASVSVARQLTGKTSLAVSGSYSLIRFISTSQGSAGLDNDTESGQASLSHQIDARSSFSASYSYSQSTYPGITGFISQTATGQYSYRVNRKLGLSFAVGPQWSDRSNVAGSNSTSLFADASATYAGKTVTSGLSVSRSTNSGFGAISGAISDSVAYNASRRFAMVWNVSGSAAYTHSSGLQGTGVPSLSTNTYVEGIQLSRAIMRNLSGFVSYTFEDQSNAGTGGLDLFSGRSQVAGFGVTYSPGSIHLGRP